MNNRHPSPAPSRLKRRAPAPMALEQRVMFDGAAVDAAAAAVAAAVAERSAQDAAVRESANKAEAQVPQAVDAEKSAAESASQSGPRVIAVGDPAANGGRREVLFIDAAVKDWQTLVGGLGAGIEVVLLDAAKDGVRQIADYLQGRSGIDAIHLIGHGEGGTAQLGTARLNSSTLPAYREALAAIGATLAADGDLLLYGCDIGKGTAGVDFLGQLAQATGADVAASSDATGAAAVGGDWILEAGVGTVETAALRLDAYNGLLANPVISNLNDRSITEDAPAVVIDSDITFSNGVDYVGGYLRFEVGNSTNGDVLSMVSSATPNASGAISFDNGTVYQGNGSGRVAIGVVDPYENGQAGKALKIVFYKGFTNGGFESANISGWTQNLQTYPVNLNGQNINYSFSNGTQTGTGRINILAPSSLGTKTINIVNTGASNGIYALEIASDGSVPTTTGGDQANGNNSLHGPYITSDAFTGFAGQQMALDWKAQGGSDAYEVFGYLLAAGTDGQFGTADDVRTQLFAQRGDTQPWKTETITFAADGLYKFEFLCGTYDKTGGGAVGAKLYVDNIRLLTAAPTINDATLTAIARQVTYAINKDAPPSNRTLTVSAQSGDGGTGSAQADISVGPVNDAPVNQTAPSIGGAVHPGQTVTANAGTWVDPDGPTNITYTYQWYLADDAGGSNATAISGAIGSTYTPGAGELGRYLSVKVTATDDGIGSGGNQSATAWSAYRAVANAAPTGTAQTVSGFEDGAQLITLGGSDADGDAISRYDISVLPSGGQLYQVNEDGSRGALIVVAGLVTNSAHKVIFVPSADAYGAGLGNFKFRVTDSLGATSGDAQVTVNVASVNDAPVLSGGADVTYKENAANTPVLIAPGITLSDDLFNGNLGGAVLTIDITNGALGDQLSLFNQGTGPGQVGFAINQGTGAITYGGVTVGVFSSTNDGKTVTITFANNVAPVVNPASVTREAVEAVLKNLQFFNTSKNPLVGDRSISISLNDAGGTANGGTATGSVLYTVHVEATNNAPTNITLGDSTGTGAWGSTIVAPGNSLVDGLGQPVNPGSNGDGRYTNADFGEIVIPVGDDGSTAVNVSDIFPDGFNFCGTTYSGAQFYVGWNGYVTFGQGMSSYAPSGISQSTVPIIAPMFLDFDTRGGKSTAGNADGGNSTGSNRIYVDKDPVNKVVTITYDDVGEYSNIKNVANSFQIRLWDKGNGDFDIEFRYENVGWAKHGSSWTSAGWSAGDRTTFSEIDGSMTSQMANLASMSNIGQAGVFLWQVRDGGVRTAGVAVAENSAPGTVVTPISTADVDDSNFTYQIKLPDGSYSDSDGTFKVVKNAAGTWELQVAPGANIDYETAQSHTVTLKVTDSGGGEGPGHELSFEKVFTIPVLDVNEAPTDITLSGNTVVENSAGGTIIGTLGTADQDGGDRHTYTIVGGDTDKFAIANGRLVVKPGASLDYETARSHTVTVRSTDSGGLFREETFTIDVANVYEPVWFDSNGAHNSYTENGSPVVIDGAIRVLAPEGSFNGGYLQIALNGNGEGSDRISVIASGYSLISVNGNSVLYDGTVIGTIDNVENGRNGQPLRIRLNADADVTGVQALARSIGFWSASENPSAATRHIQFSLSDGQSLAIKAALVDVVPVNDAPVAGLPPLAIVTERTNDDPGATTHIRGLSVSDVDETGLVTVVLSSKDLGGGSYYGSFTINSAIAGGVGAGAISGNGSGTVTLRGTLAQINATLGASDGVSYTPGLARDSVETGNDRLTLSVTDSGGLTTVRGADITVVPGIPTAHSQNYISPEDPASPIVVDLSALVTDLNLTNAHYALGKEVPGGGGLMSNFGPAMEIRDGNGTLQGYRLEHGQLMLQPGTTLDQGRFTYQPDANWYGAESFNYIFQNSQQSSEMAYIRIFVTPVNDAPVNVTAPDVSGDLRGDGTLRQNGTVTGQGTWSDVDNAPSELGYRYQWQVADDAAGTNLRDIDGATLAQYKVSGADIGKFVRLKVTANDGSIDSSPAYSAFKLVTNADPVLAAPPVAPAAIESVPFSFTLPDGTFTDSDGDTLTYSATLADGSPLPTWLHFDPLTRSFSGTPSGVDIGDLSIKVTASDGGYHPASATFGLRIVGVPPVVPDAPGTPGGGLPPGGGTPGLPETPGLPPGLPGVPTETPGLPGFPDGGGQPGGGGLPGGGWPGGLPGGLPGEPGGNPGNPGTIPPVIEMPGTGGIPGYNPPGTVDVPGTGGNPGTSGNPGGPGDTGTPGGTGVPGGPGTPGGGANGGTGDGGNGGEAGGGNGRNPAEASGSASGGSGNAGASADGGKGAAGQGRATASEGLTRAEGFQILVRTDSGNDSQTLRIGRVLDDQDLPLNKSFQVTVPMDAFVHSKVDAVIKLVATLADGSALPPWVEFDAAKGIFRGVPPTDYEGVLEVVVTARDDAGNLVSQRFRIRVGDGAVGKVALSEQLRAGGSHARHAERMNLVKVARAAAVAKRAA